MQQRQGVFNNPPGAAETTAIRRTPLDELRGDPAAFEKISMRLRVESGRATPHITSVVTLSRPILSNRSTQCHTH